MGVLLTLLGLLIAVLVLGGIFALAANRPVNASRPPRLTKAEKSENAALRARLKASEELIQRIDKLAYDHRVLDPELSFIITDAISAHKLKQLD